MPTDDMWLMLWDAGFEPLDVLRNDERDEWQVVLPLSTDEDETLNLFKLLLPVEVRGYACALKYVRVTFAMCVHCEEALP